MLLGSSAWLAVKVSVQVEGLFDSKASNIVIHLVIHSLLAKIWESLPLIGLAVPCN